MAFVSSLVEAMPAVSAEVSLVVDPVVAKRLILPQIESCASGFFARSALRASLVARIPAVVSFVLLTASCSSTVNLVVSKAFEEPPESAEKVDDAPCLICSPSEPLSRSEALIVSFALYPNFVASAPTVSFASH